MDPISTAAPKTASRGACEHCGRDVTTDEPRIRLDDSRADGTAPYLHEACEKPYYSKECASSEVRSPAEAPVGRRNRKEFLREIMKRGPGERVEPPPPRRRGASKSPVASPSSTLTLHRQAVARTRHLDAAALDSLRRAVAEATPEVCSESPSHQHP